jgi:hypothetical protein
MNNALKNSFIFVVGAAIGSIVTWKLLETNCENRIREEVESVKEAFRNRYSREDADSDVESAEEADETEEPLDIKKYAAKLKEEGYRDYSDLENNEEVLHTAAIDAPYVISPDEFAEFDDYEHITLFYYIDGVVATRDDEIIDDVDDVVGLDSLTRFGEYEDDAVHVRNDARKCDYEILRSQMSYPEVIKTKPHHQTEVK